MSKKSNLFKFVTLRNPQLLDEDRKKYGFVQYADEANSYFDTAASGSASTRYSLLKTASGVFKNDSSKALLSRSALSTAFPELTKFSTWLSKNKNAITVENINTAISDIGVVSLSTADLNKIWDNLIYQAIADASRPVRESLIQLVKAEAFYSAFQPAFNTSGSEITEFTEDLEREYKRRAKANVIVSERFLPYVTKVVNNDPKLSSTLIKRLNDEMQVAIAEENKKHYKKKLIGLEIEEKANLIQLAADFDVKNTEYKAAVKAYKADTSNQVTKTITLADGSSDTIITYPNLENDVVFTAPTLTQPSAQSPIDLGDSEQSEVGVPLGN